MLFDIAPSHAAYISFTVTRYAPDLLFDQFWINWQTGFAHSTDGTLYSFVVTTPAGALPPMQAVHQPIAGTKLKQVSVGLYHAIILLEGTVQVSSFLQRFLLLMSNRLDLITGKTSMRAVGTNDNGEMDTVKLLPRSVFYNSTEVQSSLTKSNYITRVLAGKGQSFAFTCTINPSFYIVCTH